MGAKGWSDEEKATLRKICESGDTLLSQMHRLPGRTYDAAKAIASRKLGVSSSGVVAWTDAEREILKEIWSSEVPIKIGLRRLPGRSYDSARGMAAHMELPDKVRAPKGCAGSWLTNAIDRELELRSPQSAQQLAERIGANKGSIRKILNAHRRSKYRISEWTRRSVFGNPIGMWELDSERDTRRPKPMGKAEYNRRHRIRQQMKVGQTNPFAVAMSQVMMECAA